MVTSATSASRSGVARVGAVLWLLTGVLFIGQVITAVGWDTPSYSWTENAISDLGVTGCGDFDDLGGQVRAICSPFHAVFNIATMLTGALVAVGGWLLRDAWSTRPSSSAMLLMVPAGASIAAVGAMPWDRLPDLHDLAATAQWGLQLVAMILLSVAQLRDHGQGSRLLATGTLLIAAVSVTGFVLFLAGPDLQSVIGWGLAERMAFDVLTLWTMAVGAHVLAHRPGRAHRDPGLSQS